ncbi:hypothetical protein EJ08DRAFT_71925 [Tothia fuscella]|uniref:WIBG Mago-binding domain-containing protein n=1 Tax=Tothia fuscella TaxID=1048955 RepID=A0A9P4NEH3_9PEZI|nr:hypothetical protein EJ08DRAFT_71925 [Tothia fuscella]
MTKDALSEAASKAGITTNPDGTRFIPASTRPDGSMRREIKVKPGYRPPEDVEVYKNRTAEAWKNRGKGGVPGAEAVNGGKDKDSAAAGKNAKRREARKRAADQVKKEEGIEEGSGGKAGEGKDVEVEETDPEVEQAKEAKKLVKKLRQAKELKDKKDQGTALLPEQIGKVIRINELIRQLDALGFDTEGEKKTEDAT